MKKEHNNTNREKTAYEWMPKTKKSRAILRKRAEDFAKPRITQKDSENVSYYIRFRLGPHEYYGIPYSYAKEVIHNTLLTKVPCTPEFIAGVINWRGSLTAVLDLKKFFLTSTEQEKNSHIIIVTGKGLTLGILADAIEGSAIYDTTTLEVPLYSKGILKPDYIEGLHQGRTTIINMESIFLDPEIQIKK